jgi:hypothetical protein
MPAHVVTSNDARGDGPAARAKRAATHFTAERGHCPNEVRAADHIAAPAAI